jgi:methylated-DNA-[protein]-cysteine S-methyltransferase
MHYYSITTKTPLDDFHMIVEGGADAASDVVRASGFGTLRELMGRLPKSLHSEKIVKLSEVDAAAHPFRKAVLAYFAGDKVSLDAIPRKQDGTAFNYEVWKAISTVKYGQTITYKDLAARAGSPDAVRAAGTICGKNTLILLVPCHRIVRSDGAAGEYLYGTPLKEALLKMEKPVV